MPPSQQQKRSRGVLMKEEVVERITTTVADTPPSSQGSSTADILDQLCGIAEAQQQQQLLQKAENPATKKRRTETTAPTTRGWGRPNPGVVRAILERHGELTQLPQEEPDPSTDDSLDDENNNNIPSTTAIEEENESDRVYNAEREDRIKALLTISPDLLPVYTQLAETRVEARDRAFAAVLLRQLRAVE